MCADAVPNLVVKAEGETGDMFTLAYGSLVFRMFSCPLYPLENSSLEYYLAQISHSSLLTATLASVEFTIFKTRLPDRSHLLLPTLLLILKIRQKYAKLIFIF